MKFCFSVFISILVISCVPIRPASFTDEGPRTIQLGTQFYSEADLGKFVSWACKEPNNGREIKVEVGYFHSPKFEGKGFVLFDGGYKGELTSYRRTGLEHRWDWGGKSKNEYPFVIQTDGTGLYYDFTILKEKSPTDPRADYKCSKW